MLQLVSIHNRGKAVRHCFRGTHQSMLHGQEAKSSPITVGMPHEAFRDFTPFIRITVLDLKAPCQLGHQICCTLEITVCRIQLATLQIVPIFACGVWELPFLAMGNRSG